MIINFRLKVGRDDEIISWINSLGENDRSYHVREVLRNYVKSDKPPVAIHNSSLPYKTNTNYINGQIDEATDKSSHKAIKNNLESAFESWF